MSVFKVEIPASVTRHAFFSSAAEFQATQTEEDSYCTIDLNRSRPPQLGASRYAVVNTSTGSSTSGVVDLDFSSGSNKSEPHYPSHHSHPSRHLKSRYDHP